MKIKIPDELKPWLVDDWDFINRQKKVRSVQETLILTCVLIIPSISASVGESTR